jgi:hypothetical protein
MSMSQFPSKESLSSQASDPVVPPLLIDEVLLLPLRNGSNHV